MKNIKIENIERNWETRQKFTNKEEPTFEKRPNLKRSRRYGYCYEEKLISKYGILDCYDAA